MGALLRRSCPLLALLLCFQILRTSQAFEVRTRPHHTAPAHCSSAKLQHLAATVVVYEYKRG